MANPTSPNQTTIVNVKFGVDVRDGLRAAEKLQKDIGKHMKKIQTAVGKSDKGVGKLWKQIGGSRAKQKGIKDLKTQYESLGKVVEDIEEKFIKDAREEVRKTKKGSPERKEARARLKDIKRASGYDRARAAQSGAKKQLKQLEGITEFDSDKLQAGAEEAGEALTEPLRELFLGKDLTAKVRLLSKLVAKTGSDGVKKQAEALKDFGKSMSQRGKDTKAQGGAMKWAKGTGQQAMGGLAKGLSGVVGIIAKLGPAISMLTSFMMGLVKIMFDAEAGQKDWNKQVLAVSGTSNRLIRNFGDVGKAAKELDSDLVLLREGGREAQRAFDSMGLGLNINLEAIQSYQAAVLQEGVSMERLGTAIDGATASTEGHQQAVETGIVFSRAFGVSMNEIAQLQGQLMSELAMNNKEVKESFQAIAKGAAEAGIESQKFFGVIRQFSSDLSLFTLRISEVAKVMGVLGKTMDPKKMGQALQALSGSFGGGTMSNATLAMMGGKKSKGIQDEGSERRIAASEAKLREALLAGKDEKTAKQISQDIAALGKQMRAPGENIQRVIATFAAKYGGELKEARGAIVDELAEAAEVQRLLQTGELLDQAAVKDQQDLLGKLADAFSTFEGMPGRPQGMNLMNASGKVKKAFEDQFGDQETKAAQQTARGLMQVQEELINRVQESAKTGKLAPSDAAMLQKLKIKGTGAEAVTELKKLFHEGDLMKGFTAIFNAMDESSQAAIEGAAQQQDFQKETASFQTSVTDKLTNLSENWMSQLAEWLKNIYDMIENIYESLPGWLKPGVDEDLTGVKKVADETKNSAIIAAFKDAKSLNEGARNLIGTVGKEVVEGVQKAIQEYKELDAKVKTERDPEKKQAMLNRMRELRRVTQYEDMSTGSLRKDYSSKGAEVLIGKLVRATENLARVNQPQPVAPVPKFVDMVDEPAPRGGMGVAPPVPPNARGGMVTGIMGGMAQVRRAAPGEGLASVGRGERIIPAGRGGGVTVQLELKGDLKRFIQARVVEGSAAHDRNKRLR